MKEWTTKPPEPIKIKTQIIAPLNKFPDNSLIRELRKRGYIVIKKTVSNDDPSST